MNDYSLLRPLKPISGIPTPEVGSLTLLTYNVLAQQKIRRSLYPYANSQTLKWNHRKDLLAAELTAYSADIACFQEMDHYSDYFENLLHTMHYTVFSVDRVADCNCIAWKKDRFRLVEQRSISLASTTQDKFVEAAPNVVVLVALQLIQNPTVIVVVATSHLYWRPECNDIRLEQMRILLSNVTYLCHELKTFLPNTCIFPIIAGDFNSTLHNPSIRYVLEEQRGPSLFRDAFTRYQEADPIIRLPEQTSSSSGIPYTTYCQFIHVLDHILYGEEVSNHTELYNLSESSSDTESKPSILLDESEVEELRRLSNPLEICMEPSAIRILPTPDVIHSETALPNNIYASDHFALQVQFSFYEKSKSLY